MTTKNGKPGKSIPHIPIKFEDAVKAALETKPEKKKPTLKGGSQRSKKVPRN